MLTKDTILATLRGQRLHLASEFGVRRIGIFGSYARDQQRDESDIDFLAEFERPLGLKFVEFTEYLQDLFSKEVDVLTPAGVEAIRNQRIAAEIRASVVYA